MKNNFYSPLVRIDHVHERLNEFEIEEHEKNDLLDLLHSHIHITVIDVVLSELDEEKKKEFLHLVAIKEDHEGAWQFVVTNIEKGEEKVKQAIDKIIDDFVNDLQEE